MRIVLDCKYIKRIHVSVPDNEARHNPADGVRWLLYTAALVIFILCVEVAPTQNVSCPCLLMCSVLYWVFIGGIGQRIH